MNARDRLAMLPDLQLLEVEAAGERIIGADALRAAVLSLRQCRRVVEAASRVLDFHTYDTESQ